MVQLLHISVVLLQKHNYIIKLVLQEEDLEQAESADDLMMKEWADYCEFKCSVCQEVVFSNVKLNLHVVRRHKLKNMKEYRKVPRSYLSS